MANQEADRARRARHVVPTQTRTTPPREAVFAGSAGEGPLPLIGADGAFTAGGLYLIAFQRILLNLRVLRPTTGVSASVQTADALSHPPQTPSIHVTEL